MQSYFCLRHSADSNSNDNSMTATSMIVVTLLVMIGATLIVHTGLSGAIAKVCNKIASCHQCSTFWACLVTLIVKGGDPVIAIMLSVAAAYLSNYFALLLMWAQDLYNKLWDRISKLRDRQK